MSSLPEVFGPLSTDEAAHLQALLQPVEFDKESLIFAAGARGDSVYLIDEGEVRIETAHHEVDTDGIIGFCGPGSVLGELSLLDHMPRSATAVANTPVKARRIGAAEIEGLSEKQPALVLKIIRALGREAAVKLRRLTDKFSEYMFPSHDPEVEEMVEKATRAQAAFASWSEEKVDALLTALAEEFGSAAQSLAEATVAETHVGNVPDKTIKNKVAAYQVLRSLLGQVGAGALGAPSARKVTDIASPAGVVFGLIPMTNPVATAVFKILSALKSRNAIIVSFHHAALGVGNRVGMMASEVLQKHGAPADLVQWVKHRSNRKKSLAFMAHDGVGLVLATGGAAMVKSAYSSGTPALGVGPGNAPCWVSDDADLDLAAQSVVASKSFDNGLICGAEHNLVVDQSVRAGFIVALERAGAAVLSPEETQRFNMAAIDPETHHFRGKMVGQSAQLLAGIVKIERPYPIKLLVVPWTWAGEATPYAGEKMQPLLSLFTVSGEDEALKMCRALLTNMGAGHTAIIHTRDEGRASRFASVMPASRVLVNSPGSQGVVGLTTGLLPSFTLGCGTFGGNSTSDNVTYRNLRNVKRMAWRVEPDLG